MYLQHISAQRCPEPIKNMRGIVVHCISFHDKLTAYCGASDQFDQKLKITAYNAESKEKSSCLSRLVKMKSSCLSEVDQLLAEVNVKLCEANVQLSQSFEVKSRRILLPRVQMILTELEWIVKISDDDDSDTSLSSCSLSWDNYNERKCEMSDTRELSNYADKNLLYNLLLFANTPL